jgi:hypothetical protein
MKQLFPNFDDYISEQLAIPAKKWTNYILKDLDKDTMSLIWDMYTKTYAAEHMDFSATDMDDLQQKYSAIFLIDIDKDKIPDAFIIYRKTSFGNKIALGGTNGLKDAKIAFIKKQIDLIVNTPGWYAEGSGKIDDMLIKNKAPYINNEQIVRTILNKDIEWQGDGYYTRGLSRAAGIIKKRMYGTPKI